MRIDAHHHLWDLSAVHYPWLMAKGVERFFGDPTPIQRNYLIDEFRRDANGFEGSVHIQVGAEDGEAEARWVQAVADQNADWPLAQVVFCDLTEEGLEDRLDRFQALSTVRGVRQIVGRAPGEDAVTGTNALLENPRFAEGLRLAGNRGLSFDLQLIPALYQGMADVLDDVPEVPVALCHVGSPHDRSETGLRDWAKRLRLLSDRPQVVCKLSGLGMFEHDWTAKTVQPIVATCLEQFGADRCMFGSNFPVDSLTSDYSTIVSAFEQLLPVEVHRQVFGTAAEKFYNFSND